MAHLLVRSIVVLIVGLICYFALIAQGDDLTSLAQQAEAAYVSENYALASELYEQIIERNVDDFAIYYNAGSAFYQSGELGHALRYFLEAQKLNPRSQALNLVIARIRAERVDYLPESTHITDVLGRASVTLLTLRELQTISLIFWSLWFVLWGVFFFRRSLRPRIRIFQWIVGIVTGLLLILMVSRMWLVSYRPTGVVTIPVAQVMSGPGEDYLLLYRLFSAAELRVTDTVDGWARFSLGDGRQGWIHLDAIGLVDD